MKVHIHKDEWYPVFGISNWAYYGREVDVSDELYERYKKALHEFDEIQDILSNLYDAAVEHPF